MWQCQKQPSVHTAGSQVWELRTADTHTDWTLTDHWWTFWKPAHMSPNLKWSRAALENTPLIVVSLLSFTSLAIPLYLDSNALCFEVDYAFMVWTSWSTSCTFIQPQDSTDILVFTFFVFWWRRKGLMTQYLCVSSLLWTPDWLSTDHTLVKTRKALTRIDLDLKHQLLYIFYLISNFLIFCCFYIKCLLNSIIWLNNDVIQICTDWKNIIQL